MDYTLKPDAQGYLIIDNKNNTYKPNDKIYLIGNFKAIAVYNLSGTVDGYITITNAPGEKITIGDPLWSGGSWAHGLALRSCHYINVFGSSKDSFVINGSTSTVLDSNGYPVRTAYFNLMITEMSDNFSVHDLTIKDGGTGLFCKTEVSSTDSKTWFPNSYLENFSFYNLDISGTYNEGMYIGHTATYWNIKTNSPVYSGTIDPTIMKQPIKLRNVTINNNYVHNISNDAIQTAAIDGLVIRNNIVTAWGLKKDYNNNGGILIGGRVTNFIVQNNSVRDGWGEFLQIYADAGPAVVSLNLFANNFLSGIEVRGTKGLVVSFTNNTIVNSGEHAFRINGTSGNTESHILSKNIIAAYGGKSVYLENGGNVIDKGNYMFTTFDASGLKATDDYVTPSSMTGYGYKEVIPPAPPVKNPIAILNTSGWIWHLYDDGSADSSKL